MAEGDETKGRRNAKKERVLHTRVPAVLEQELKRVARAWRVPVSNLVRALLEDALDTIDVVGEKAEGELRSVVDLLSSERHRFRQKSAEQLSKIPGAEDADEKQESAQRAAEASPTSAPLRGAIGATPIILVHDATCGVTGETLPAGSEAYVVLFDDPGRKLITGRDSLPGASTSNEEKADD